MRGAIHQFCAGFATGDAISNEALLLQKFIRSCGIESEIFAEQFPDRDAVRVKHASKFRATRDTILVYHHSIDTGFLGRLQGLPCKKILLYHNVTPPEYVLPYNRAFADRLQHARESLLPLTGTFDTVLADSLYNANDLQAMGFTDVTVLPVALQPLWQGHAGAARHDRLTVLFVGRVFPNKRHQDLLKTFYFLKRIEPTARLLLVGSFHPEMRGYTAELGNWMRELELTDVEFTGMVTDEQVIQSYLSADVFLSMSEHEGFFVPLLESMHFGLPILAHKTSVIPETLGNSGVMFERKEFAATAEMIVELWKNDSLRESVIRGQRLRALDFENQKTFDIFRTAVQSIDADRLFFKQQAASSG
ncbi:MAG: glycosyltransferase [Leptospirales bacterium]|nr:glycosyltransferase [Leptospirales bacterium]